MFLRKHGPCGQKIIKLEDTGMGKGMIKNKQNFQHVFLHVFLHVKTPSKINI